MRDIIVSLFGSYTPLSGEGLASIDFEWILGVVLFLVLLVCVFKLIGVFLKK